MKIELYMDYISQPSRTVLAFCKLSNIPVEIKEIRIAKMDHMTEEYESINPMKKENKLSLGESHVITNYLIQKYQLERQWGCQGLVERAKINQYLDYHHQNTRRCSGVLYTEVFSRLYPVDQKSLPNAEVLRGEVRKVLDFIEEHYFKDSQFMIGKNLTVPDLAAYFEIHSLIVVDFQFSQWTKISRWMQIMGKIKQVQQTNHNFMRLLPKIKPQKAKL